MGKRPTGSLSSGKAVAVPPCSENSFSGFDSFVKKIMKMKSKLFILLSLSLVLLTTACKTKDVPGRVRAPRHCNTCTKWSYVPQETIDTFNFQCMSFRPTEEGGNLCAERFYLN